MISIKAYTASVEHFKTMDVFFAYCISRGCPTKVDDLGETCSECRSLTRTIGCQTDAKIKPKPIIPKEEGELSPPLTPTQPIPFVIPGAPIKQHYHPIPNPAKPQLPFRYSPPVEKLTVIIPPPVEHLEALKQKPYGTAQKRPRPEKTPSYPRSKLFAPRKICRACGDRICSCTREEKNAAKEHKKVTTGKRCSVCKTEFSHLCSQGHKICYPCDGGNCLLC